MLPSNPEQVTPQNAVDVCEAMTLAMRLLIEHGQNSEIYQRGLLKMFSRNDLLMARLILEKHGQTDEAATTKQPDNE